MAPSVPRRIVITGGNGQVGQVLARHFHSLGDQVTVVARRNQPAPWSTAAWDGVHSGPWISSLNGADLVINLAGRNVNCRYTDANRREILESRVRTTHLLGDAVAKASPPPRVWMNASTATIYRHALDRPMDEATGEFGGQEPDAPRSWGFSIQVATAWERALFDADTPQTRRIALRAAPIMSPDRGGIFDVLLRLVRFGAGGASGSGRQYISWLHDRDLIRMIEFLFAHEELEGPVNLSSPQPLPNRDFMRVLRQAWGAPIGLPATEWMLHIAAFLMRTETELILKSRRVIPTRLLDAGYTFAFADWPTAAEDLVRRWRNQDNSGDR